MLCQSASICHSHPDEIANHYHKPSDEYSSEWDLRGAVDDIRLLFQVGVDLVYSRDFPSWSEGSEFKARRDAMMGGEQ